VQKNYQSADVRAPHSKIPSNPTSDYKPYIFLKNVLVPFLNINRSEKWGKEFTSRGL
jgi:hypothetical protein